jgi:predicted AlkP superfamily phosphohydrolase/phosphomutase/tetratricopeptide (TPR) repeat protein
VTASFAGDHSSRLVVVGWDSADWKIINPLLERGEMPMLAKLVAEGTAGNLTTLEPSISPMLWTSIATGRHPAEHGVHGFTEVKENRVWPVSAATRRCRAVWNILSEHGLKTNLVGWFASQGERDPNVHLVSDLFSRAPEHKVSAPGDWPPPPAGTFWPESLNESLEELRVHPSELDADLMRMFIPRLHEIDLKKDKRPYLLAQYLAEAFSIQAAATWLMEHKPWNLSMIYFRAIDEICHHFMHFHPPRMEGVPESDFHLYADVVNSTYRLHDLMLSRLVDLAGPEADVLLISDHGFHSDQLRPRLVPRIPAGIIAWHRSQGIFAARGSHFKKNKTLYGARLPDITPTILSWFGLPRARDMEGRVLSDALVSDRVIAPIDTWEKEGMRPEVAEPWKSCDGTESLVGHFIALGYLDASAAEGDIGVHLTELQNRAQLAQALMHSGRFEEALPLLEDLIHHLPQRVDLGQRLAYCQLQLGLAEAASQTLEQIVQYFDDPIIVKLIWANAAYEMGDADKALILLREVQAQNSDAPELRIQLARTLLKLRHWDDAENEAKSLIQNDPDSATAWTILARCKIHQEADEEAREAATRAIHLEYNFPMAHLYLGIALARMKRYPEANEAFLRCLELAPAITQACRLLAQSLHQQGQKDEAAQLISQASFLKREADQLQKDRLLRVKQGIQQRAETRAKMTTAARPEKSAEALDLIVVTGLPRSGTSLMMDILQAGGLPILTDGKRRASEDNPRGFFEWEAIQGLPKNPGLLKQASGRAVKIVTPLLPCLPTHHRYQVIFMRRPVMEVVRSQLAMLERRGQPSPQSPEKLAHALTQHTNQILEMLRKAKSVELVEINYPDLIQSPGTEIPRIQNFLGAEKLPNIDKMVSCIDPTLYRQR